MFFNCQNAGEFEIQESNTLFEALSCFTNAPSETYSSDSQATIRSKM